MQQQIAGSQNNNNSPLKKTHTMHALKTQGLKMQTDMPKQFIPSLKSSETELFYTSFVYTASDSTLNPWSGRLLQSSGPTTEKAHDLTMPCGQLARGSVNLVIMGMYRLDFLVKCLE